MPFGLEKSCLCRNDDFCGTQKNTQSVSSTYQGHAYFSVEACFGTKPVLPYKLITQMLQYYSKFR